MNRYPLWRYILIIILVVFGVIYALPVVYGEDPAVQVMPKGDVQVTASVEVKIADGLKSQNIPFTSIHRVNNSDVVRFADAEMQLKAQDVIQAIVGDKYTVALNLVPNTPKWLQAIGARPMKLGLDLRGGIHFLLQVVTKAVVKQRISGDMHSMTETLRNARIRYAGIKQDGNSFVIRFRTSAARDKALSLIKRDVQDYKVTQIEQGGQFLIEGQMLPDTAKNLVQYAVKQNINTLRNRVNDLGVSEPLIAQQGKDKISVDLPGIQDMARAKDIIGKVATIRLQLVDTQNNAQTAASTGIVPFGTTLYRYDGRPILLKNQVVLHGTSIISALSSIGENGQPAVQIRAGGSEVSSFNRITAENIGKPLAVVYIETKSVKKLVDGKVVTKTSQSERVINVATINSALGNSFQITNLQSMQYAKDLSLLLRSGAYVAPVVFIQERLVGPSLGKQNIRMGVLSTEIGSLLVIIFMAFYYRLFGIVADIALVLNVVFLIAIMALLGFTLTLPGIAGIVLTVGMAVDANVLINERIREELRLGMSPQAAISAGYGRAFSTIVDANVTTLIVAVVLFALGTGSVKGFAVTLSIGLLLSMMTSIFFTRAIINLIYGQRRVDHLSIGIKVKKK